MSSTTLVVLVLAAMAGRHGLAEEPGCKKPLVEITVSSLVSKSKKISRTLDISWEVEDWKQGDYVTLHNADPGTGSPVVFKSNVGSGVGWVRTNTQENRRLTEPNYKKECGPYWAAYWRQGASKPLTTSCLSTNPTWMEEMRNDIKHMRLKDIFIPGTHDSGSFIIRIGPYRQNRYQKYVYTQDESIMDQLLHGARILDLRIGHYKGEWWINHDIVKVHPFASAVHDIKLFLDNTNEIVVLDLHRFPVGFKEAATHDKFVAYLKSELGDYMTPALGWYSATLGDIWGTNKRLVVAYNDGSVVPRYSSILWSGVSQRWAEALEPEDLFAYLQKTFDSWPSYPNSAMAELTPTPWSVVTDKYNGLRGMANLVNHNVTAKFRGQWGRACNGVAVDFIRSTGIVEAAIRWNRRRARNSQCD